MYDNIGRLVLRLAIGGLMLFHGVNKLINFGATVDGMGGMLDQQGLPSQLVYGVFLGEVVAPILIIIGFLTRPAALVLSFTMVMAIGLAHRAEIFQLAERGGAPAIELPLLYLLGGIAIALLGAGEYSVSRGKWRWD